MQRRLLIALPLVALAFAASARGPLGPQPPAHLALTQDQISTLVADGPSAIPELAAQARSGPQTARGWAVVGITTIGGPKADAALQELHDDPNEDMLVRTWAVAGRLQLVEEIDELIALSSTASGFPGAKRPLEQAASRVAGELTDVEEAIVLMGRVPSLAPTLAAQLAEAPADDLLAAMLQGSDNTVRWQAASYTALAGQARPEKVARATIEALQFRPGAKTTPWEGGALYVPGISWDRAEARTLVRALAAWYRWAEKKGDSTAMGQVQNNLQSVSLLRAAGYSSMQDALEAR